jgi:cytochrome c553
MRPVVRRAGYVAGAIALLGLTGYTAAFGISHGKLSRKYEVAVKVVPIPADAEAIAWGSHMVNAVTGCQDCHGPTLGGKVMSDDAVGVVTAPNLTSGRGGLGGGYADEDWVRAIRHGVRRDGSSLLIMPSYAYASLSDRDLGAMIAYLKQMPAVDNELPGLKLRPMGRALVALGVFDEDIVARKTPQRERYDEVEAGLTLEYGRYLASVSGCTSCHRPELTGGPSGPPDAPPAADISPAGLAGWTWVDFERSMREGTRPDGSQVSDFMPWRVMGRMTDDELRAIWLFLQEGPTTD